MTAFQRLGGAKEGDVTQEINPSEPETSAAIRSLGGKTTELDTADGWIEVEFGPAGDADSRPALRPLLEGLLAEVTAVSVAGAESGQTVYVKANVAEDRPQEILIGRARVMQTAPTVAYAEGELRTTGGQLCATGSSMVRIGAAGGAQ